MTADAMQRDDQAIRTVRSLGRLRHGNPPGDPSSAPRCGARTRRGTPCKAPAVRGRRRCRMHGGTNPGPPLGNRNGWRHGRRSAAAVAARKMRTQVQLDTRELLSLLKGLL